MKNQFLFTVLIPVVFLFNPEPASGQTAVNDTLALTETALNYGDGFYSGSAERMEKALCPDLLKLAPMKLPNSDVTVMIQSTYTGLIEMSRAKTGFLEEAKRKTEVKVLHIQGDLALVRLTSAQFNDYLAMARIDGQWKIVNVLWTFGPDSPQRPGVPVLNSDEQKPLVEKAVREFVEGLFTTDPGRMEQVMHPRFSQATVAKIPQTGKMLVSREGYDMILGYARAKMTAQDPSKWNFQIRMVDYMDGIALAELTTPAGSQYLQLVNISNKWQITSNLRKR